MGNPVSVTQLLRAWAAGNADAHAQLIPLVYDTLHRLAGRYLADERNARTLQPTALVNEAYIRLVGNDVPDWQSRGHFFGVAAHLMRQILVEHARKRLSQKRGGGAVALDIEAAGAVAAPGQGADVIALNDALDRLASVDERKTRIVEMRYFGGLTEEETGQALGISVATVRRDLRMAEAWLSTQLNPGAQDVS